MKNNKKIVGILFVLFVCTVFSFASGQKDTGTDAEQSWVMKISHAGPVSDMNDDYVGASSIKSYIEEHSNGKISVEIYSGNQLGTYEEVMEQVDNGTLEVAHTSIGGVTPFIPELAVVDLQYLIPGDEVVGQLMKGPFFDEMRDAVMEVLPNVKLVGVSDGGRWRSFYTTKTEVKSAEDLKGLKIRTISSPLQQEFTNQTGASATPVAWSEVYVALGSGIVDGLKIATPDILSNSLDESIRFGVLDRHTFLFGFYFISDSWLNALPADLQQVVLDGITYGTEQQTTFNQNREEQANREFVAEGGKIHELTDDERATFLPARNAMMEWYKSKYGDKWLNSLLDALEIAENELN